MAPASACVVLVPSNGPIEPDCERGLHALEAKGYRGVRGADPGGHDIRLTHVGKYSFTWDDLKSGQERKSGMVVPGKEQPPQGEPVAADTPFAR